MTDKESAKYWKEKYEHQHAQFLSLRELYNKTIRYYDIPEVRLIMAKKFDQQRAEVIPEEHILHLHW